MPHPSQRRSDVAETDAPAPSPDPRGTRPLTKQERQTSGFG